MTDNDNVPVVDKGDTGMPVIIYALYLGGFVTGGLSSIVGVVLAYISRGDAPAWLQSHYRFQIRTFWLLILFSVISGLLAIVLVGILTGILASIWFIVRCVKGLQWTNKGQDVPNPASWWFGDAPK